MEVANCTDLTERQCALIGFYFEQIYEPLTRYCARLTGSPADGEDVASESFLGLMEEARSGRFPLEPNATCRGDPENEIVPPLGPDSSQVGDRLPSAPPAIPDHLAPHDHVAAWLYHTATRKVFNFYRSQGRGQSAFDTLAFQASLRGPEKLFQRERRRQRVLAALLKISHRQSSLLYAHACGYTYEELAEIEGVKMNTLASLMRRARIAFTQHYIADSVFARTCTSKL